MATTTEFPLAAIICLAIGGYIIIIVVIIIIKYCLQKRGIGGTGKFKCCGNEDEATCQCCITLSEKCSCEAKGVGACFDACCPNRKHFDCVDILLCQCCTGGVNRQPICGMNPISCGCGCQSPDCENVRCLCFEIQCKGPPLEEV